MANVLITALCSLLLACTSISAFAQTLTLSKDGKTDYVIVLPDAATPIEKTAAAELQKHLNAVTTSDFAIVTEAQAFASRPQILVGDSKRARQLLPEISTKNLSYDGIVIKTVGKDLVLTGHPKRGALYAVNTFLEDAVGIRWWTPTESFIPNKPTLKISAQNTQYAPKLIYREAYYKNAFDGIFETRMRINGSHARAKPEYGGQHKFQYFVHSFYPLLPPKKYFDIHPEWYSEIKGKRKHERAQLCLSNDDMRKELTKNALEALRKNPTADFLSVSQNDWAGYCECSKCAAAAKEEGSQSGPVVRFVNKVAEDIEKEFPDVWVETLAYQYTRKPPKLVKPRKNVVIRLCTIECSFAQPLAAGEQNKTLREDIQGWSRIAKHLFIWDYVTNFKAYMLPHPNLRVLAPNIRFFVEHNAIGLFEQGDVFCNAGDFVRMRNWVISHLLWNPALDEKKLFDEFLTGYYGAAAAPILKEYWKLLLDNAEKSDVYLRCYMTSTFAWLPLETLNKASQLMEKALSVAETETIRNRIRREKMVVDYVFLTNYKTILRKSQQTDLPFLGPQEPKAAVDEFFARCKEFDVTAYREWDYGKDFKIFKENLQRKVKPTAPDPDFCKKLPKNSWFDLQEYDFNMGRPDEWTFLVEDKQASNGQAVKMPGSHRSWAVSYNFDDVVPEKESSKKSTLKQKTAKFHLYAAVRCDAKTTEGAAMTLGVYDNAATQDLVRKTVSVAEISGAKYRWIDLGEVTLHPRTYFWAAPPNRPGEVEAVYVDRVVIVEL